MTQPSAPQTLASGPSALADARAYFALTFALTAPLWLAGGLSGAMLMPGLPLAGLAVVCPALAGFILATRHHGLASGWALLRRAFDGGRVRPAAWWIAVLAIAPLVSLAAFYTPRWQGVAIPDPQIAASSALGLFAVFLVGGVCEELGWTGFVLEPLQTRWGPLGAALIIGAVWAVWHYPALLQAHRSFVWIGWWTLGTLSLRAIMVWLYNGVGRSVLAVAVFHAMTNLSWQLFPVRGSWFDPRLHGQLMAGMALILWSVWRLRKRPA